jgi:hypothetical protein
MNTVRVIKTYFLTPQSVTNNAKPPIVEAQGWMINDKGQIFNNYYHVIIEEVRSHLKAAKLKQKL